MQTIQTSSRIVGAAPLLAVLCIVAARQAAWAQSSVAWPEVEYTVEQPVQVPFNTGPSLRSGEFASVEDEAKFADWFNRTLFPNITHLENRQSREDVVTRLRGYLRQSGSRPVKQVYNKLTDITLEYMQRVVQDPKYHPAVRVNAMLAIGELDSLDAAKALYETAVSKNPKVFFGLRVAAMSGLVRLAASGDRGPLADPELEPKLLKSMVAVARFHPPKGPVADGYNWMRGQAADVLAGLKSTGADGKVPDALLVMLSDTDMPIPLRTKAASALGKLDYNGNLSDAESYVKALAAFADEALQNAEQVLQGDDHAPCRGWIRQISRDVSDATQKVGPSSALANGVQKALAAFNKESEGGSTDDLKAAIAKAKAGIEGVVNK